MPAPFWAKDLPEEPLGAPGDIMYGGWEYVPDVACAESMRFHRSSRPTAGDLEAGMFLATLVKQWTLNWALADQLAKAELEERQALARDLGLTDAVLARLAKLGPESAADLPAILDAVFSRLT